MNLPQKIIVIDTETINIEKRFIYDIGFIVCELKENRYIAIEKHQYIVDQVYNNTLLFETAFYFEKKKKYTNILKGRKVVVKKLGYITQIISAILKRENITHIFAYNSPFDKGAFIFNSDYFKIKNPFEKSEWNDILAIANNFIHLNIDYINFTTKNGFVNESGYIQTNAEKTYAFIINSPLYKESHTSLADCEIELEILNRCIENGYKEFKQYKGKFIKSNQNQVFTVIHNKEVFNFEYTKKTNSKGKNEIKLTL